MATSALIQLGADDVATALDGVDLIDTMAAKLAAGMADGAGPQSGPDVRLARWRGRTTASQPGAEWVVLEHLPTGPLCVLHSLSLMASYSAAVTALAARTLLAPGPVTVAILGSGPAARLQMVVITRHLRGVARIVVWPGRDKGGSAIEASLLDQVDLAGIQIVVAAAVEEAVAAANLVVAVDSTPERIDIGALAKGSLVVNATGLGWSAGLVGAADQLFVDDVSLLKHHRDRLAGRPVDADLGQVLVGHHAGRTDRDHVVLMELLGCDVLDVQLAGLLHRVAIERALGTRLPG